MVKPIKIKNELNLEDCQRKMNSLPLFLPMNGHPFYKQIKNAKVPKSLKPQGGPNLLLHGLPIQLMPGEKCK